MFAIYIIIISLIGAFICFAMPSNKSNAINIVALIFAAITVVFTVMMATTAQHLALSETLIYTKPWIADFGINFSVQINGINAMLCLLTAISFVLIFLSTYNKNTERSNTFFGLMMLSMAGLFGVFAASDAMLFYIFWELALIPVYFLASMWGGENRIKTSFKFFIYTFVGSLIMLVALIYMYNKTPDHSFSLASFYNLKDILTSTEQNFLFWMLFIAFAIKMPIFPLHTWQPDAYQQTYTPVTMVMSGVMVKMGLWAVIRWMLPIFRTTFYDNGINTNLVTLLCVVGIIYASLLALKQNNIKRLIAYSSIAHIGLMCAAIFTNKAIGLQGASVQMFSHGINIIGLWILVFYLEAKTKTQDMDKMGGFATIHPTFTIFLVIITLANIALPLTNGFTGEFIMFNSLFNSKSAFAVIFTVIAGLGIIFGAIYSLKMIQKVAYGTNNSNEMPTNVKLQFTEWIALAAIVVMIFTFGLFPQIIIELINKI